MSSFGEKKLRVTIALNQQKQAFDDDGNNTIIIEGLRVSAIVQTGNGAVAPTLRLSVYGIKIETINRLTSIKWNVDGDRLNFVKLEASNDSGDSYHNVFEGLITFAYPDFNSPDAALVIQSMSALQHKILPAEPLSIKGEVAVSELVKQICDRMGLGFENNNVTAKISNPYIPESSLDQIQKLCVAANANMVVENNLVAIVPKGGKRTVQVPVISPKTGLLGYPMPNINGLMFECLYDPLIKFHGIVEIRDSIITQANGQWCVFGLTTYLDCMLPNGRWTSRVQAGKIGEVKVAK